LEIKEVLDFIFKKFRLKKPLVLTFFENLQNQRTSTSVFSTFQNKNKTWQFSQKTKDWQRSGSSTEGYETSS
jgi:hypothetical protein